MQIARASNPGGTTAISVLDRLDGLWCDEDFIDWYLLDGRPGLSPAQLATVCVLQFLLGLSDRQAAEAVRCRIDFSLTVTCYRSVFDQVADTVGEGARVVVHAKPERFAPRGQLSLRW